MKNLTEYINEALVNTKYQSSNLTLAGEWHNIKEDMPEEKNGYMKTLYLVWIRKNDEYNIYDICYFDKNGRDNTPELHSYITSNNHYDLNFYSKSPYCDSLLFWIELPDKDELYNEFKKLISK